jgi:MFS family permease
MTGVAIAFASMYLAAGALTPLLVDYKQRWDFAPAMLTVAFAVYAVGFLVAALTLGSLSDHVGRRPVLVAALVVQVASNLLFLAGSDVSWVIAGRIVQGVAGGAATSAFTAALVELAPAGRQRLGTILGSVILSGGLALGSLLAGLGLQLTPAANTIVFLVLTALTLLGGLAVIGSAETVIGSAETVIGSAEAEHGAAATARTRTARVAVPPSARAEFYAAAPVVAAVWMLAGLSGGLAPNLVRSLFHLDHPFLNGFDGFVAPAVAAVAGLAVAKLDSRRAIAIGSYASIIGAGAIIAGALAGNLGVMIGGQAIAGVGFGAAFTAALQLIFPLVAPHQRAATVAAVYVVSYLAFGVPIVVEGQLVDPIGEIPAVVGYTALTIVFAFAGLIAQARLTRRP